MSSILKGLQLNELSPQTLASYKKKAGADATAADKAGDYKRGNKRFSGIVKATKKEFDNDAKKELSEKMDSRFSKTEWISLDDALKILKHYGARIEKWGGHESFYYYDREGVRHFVGDLSWNADDTRNVKLSLINQAVRHLRSQAVSEANNYHANRTGFSRPSNHRDDERHDLDTPTQVWGLKINGKVWSKDGKYVTFKTKEAALNIRNSILKNRPDLEIGLVTKGGISEVKGTYGSYSSDDYYNARQGHEYGVKNPSMDSGAYEFEKNVPAGEPGGPRGAPKSLKGISKSLPADAFGRTTGKIPKGKPGTVHSMMRDIDEDELDENCWKGYHKEGNKELFGKTVPNCVKNEGVAEGSLEEYGDTNKGQKMLGKVHQRAADRVTSKQADKDPAYARKAQQTQDRAWDRLAVKEQGVVEGQHSCPHCGGELVSEELMNEKKDACYYKVKSRYKVWPSAYASGALVKCRKKGADSWGNGGKKNESSINGGKKNESSILEGIEQVDENLHKWFKEKWVRFGPDGKIRGDCARGDDSEGKPKCLPQSKAHSLGKKGRASAAARKRREDPNPERSGKAINVNTKKKTDEDLSRRGFLKGLGAAALAGATGMAKANQEKDLGNNFVLTNVDIAGHTVQAVLDKTSNTYYALNRRADGSGAIVRTIAPYLMVKNGKAGATMTLGPDTIDAMKKAGLVRDTNEGVAEEVLDEKWSQKYKDSINCSNPKGFSQRAHCQGKNK